MRKTTLLFVLAMFTALNLRADLFGDEIENYLKGLPSEENLSPYVPTNDRDGLLALAMPGNIPDKIEDEAPQLSYEVTGKNRLHYVGSIFGTRYMGVNDDIVGTDYYVQVLRFSGNFLGIENCHFDIQLRWEFFHHVGNKWEALDDKLYGSIFLAISIPIGRCEH